MFTNHDGEYRCQLIEEPPVPTNEPPDGNSPPPHHP